MKKTIASTLLTALFGSVMVLSGTQIIRATTVGTEFTVMEVAAGGTFEGTQSQERFGYSVAVSGDGQVAAVGASDYDIGGTTNTGRVEVYLRSGDTWTQMPSIFSGSFTNDQFGYSIDLNHDGTYMAVGARSTFFSSQTGFGVVEVFKRTGNTWAPYGSPIYGNALNARFGMHVALSRDGQTVIGAGLSYAAVYQYSNGAFVQKGSDFTTSASAGPDVDISDDGQKIVIGDDRYDMGAIADVGRVQVFGWNGSAWAQIGQDIVETEANAKLGSAVSLSGNGLTLVVGSPNRNSSVTSSGVAQLFTFSSNTWNQVGATFSGTEQNEFFGYRVELSLDGTKFAINALNTDTTNGGNTGKVVVYSFIDGVISPFGTEIPGPSTVSSIGASMKFSRDGSVLGIGAHGAASTNGVSYFLKSAPAQSNDASLSTIALSSGDISFTSAESNYALQVANSVKTITVYPTASQSNATVTVNGVPVTAESGSATTLKIGKNVITIVVTAPTGTTQTYSIEITRLRYQLKVGKKLTVKKAVTTVDKSIPKGAQVRVVVSKSSKSRCSATTTRITALKKTGTCVLSVYVTPKATTKNKKPKTSKTIVRLTIYR